MICVRRKSAKRRSNEERQQIGDGRDVSAIELPPVMRDPSWDFQPSTPPSKTAMSHLQAGGQQWKGDDIRSANSNTYETIKWEHGFDNRNFQPEHSYQSLNDPNISRQEQPDYAHLRH